MGFAVGLEHWFKASSTCQFNKPEERKHMNTLPFTSSPEHSSHFECCKNSCVNIFLFSFSTSSSSFFVFYKKYNCATCFVVFHWSKTTDLEVLYRGWSSNFTNITTSKHKFSELYHPNIFFNRKVKSQAEYFAVTESIHFYQISTHRITCSSSFSCK